MQACGRRGKTNIILHEGRLLGSEEFIEEIRHRVGEHRAKRRPLEPTRIEDLLIAAERMSEHGIRNGELAEALGIDASAVTRRVEAARTRGAESPEVMRLRKLLRKLLRG
jgi:hypothetical protein